MCDLHILRDDVDFQKWGIRYADTGIEVLDEYVQGNCADGFITICKDVCEPLECANGNEPIEVCHSYETPKASFQIDTFSSGPDWLIAKKRRFYWLKVPFN